MKIRIKRVKSANKHDHERIFYSKPLFENISDLADSCNLNERSRNNKVIEEFINDHKVEKFTEGELIQLLDVLGLSDVSVEDLFDIVSNVDPVAWAYKNRKIKTKECRFFITQEEYAQNKNLLFHRPFLIQPLRDSSKVKIYKKSRQVGVSEIALIEVQHFLINNKKTKWVYTLPRYRLVKDFSKSRVSEAFSSISSLLAKPDSAFTKKIGDSYLFLRSSWEAGLGESMDADGLTLDEKDRMKPGIESAFEESLSSSKYGFIREISTPTLTGRGIDLSYRNSKKYVWHVKCENCFLEQPILYPDNIAQIKDVKNKNIQDGTFIFICRNCEKELNRYQGRYILTGDEDSPVSGYHISQLICPWISADDIMRKRQKYRMKQLWMNYVLGECSEKEDSLVKDSHFDFCVLPNPLGWFNKRPDFVRKVAVGIDWGNTNWCVVFGLLSDNRIILLNIFITEDTPDPLGSAKIFSAIIKPFQPNIIVCDAGYGKDRNAFLSKIYPQRVYSCYYPLMKMRRTSVFNPVWNDNSFKVNVDRTMSLKVLLSKYREQEILFPVGLDDEKLSLYISHHKAFSPIYEEEQDVITEYIENVGDDHLGHAANYANIGIEKFIQERNSISVSF